MHTPYNTTKPTSVPVNMKVLSTWPDTDEPGIHFAQLYCTCVLRVPEDWITHLEFPCPKHDESVYLGDPKPRNGATIFDNEFYGPVD